VAIATRCDDNIDVVRSGFLPFRGSIMERGLLWVHVRVEGKEVLFGTSHLESWIPGNDGRVGRAEQIQVVREFCESYLANVSGVSCAIVTGDLNWDDERKRAKGIDEPLIKSYLGSEWVDAWRAVKGAKNEGYTYDAKLNPMLRGNLRRRFDRFLVYFNPQHEKRGLILSAELIGKDPIPGIKWKKEVRGYNGVATGRTNTVPVLPSDHYGLTTVIRFENDIKKVETPANKQTVGKESRQKRKR